MAKDEFYDKFYNEAEKRIEEIESPDYEFPKRFSKVDLIGAILLMAVAAAFVVMGYWL